MCGRYRLGIAMEDIEDFNEILRQVKANIQENSLSPYLGDAKDYFPGEEAPLLTKEGLKVMNWGFPLDKKLVFNARGETLFEKKMFKDSAYTRRCLVPCTLFYEWKKEGKIKTKYKIDTKDQLFYLGGLYSKTVDNNGKAKNVFAIITKPSVGDMLNIHHREPLVIPKKELANFLNVTDENYKDFLHYDSPSFSYHPIEGQKQLSLF